MGHLPILLEMLLDVSIKIDPKKFGILDLHVHVLELKFPKYLNF
jgi:Fe-S-cluster formation regulator IscX/YfhJ